MMTATCTLNFSDQTLSLDQTGTARFVRDADETIGSGFHRSGWPYAARFLRGLNTEFLIDDFVEKTFCYTSDPQPHLESWIGVFHHPPFPPNFTNHEHKLKEYVRSLAFCESLPYLRGAIVLSRYMADELRKLIDVPTLAVKYPTFCDVEKWSVNQFADNYEKLLIQVGVYLRNTRAIYQSTLPNELFWHRIRLLDNFGWPQGYDRRVAQYMVEKGEHNQVNSVLTLPWVGDRCFDALMRCNVAMTHCFDASGNTTVVECTARNTPILINPHPAVVEYLGGEQYPLYFTHPKEIANLLRGDAVTEANDYLSVMDKSFLDGNVFAGEIQEWLDGL